MDITTHDINLATLRNDLMCRICHEIPTIPVKLRVYENILDYREIVCDDLYCHCCVLKLIYQWQRNDEDSLRCPICRRSVFIEVADIHTWFVEDKLVKNTIENVLRIHPRLNVYDCELPEISYVYSCGFECGYQTSNMSMLSDHYIGLPCTLSLDQCNLCTHVDTTQSLGLHKSRCAKERTVCTFCDNVICTMDNSIRTHLYEYHYIAYEKMDMIMDHFF